MIALSRTTAKSDGRIAEAGPPHQESTVSDKIKDMPEKKLDNNTTDDVKGGRMKQNPKA